MGLILLTLVGALLVGWVLGGRFTALEHLPVRGWPLLAGMLAGVWLGGGATLIGLPTALYWLGLATAAACAFAYCVRNRSVFGLGLVGAGLLLNALVIALNAGMPVSPRAAARAGVDYAETVADPRHVPADDVTLSWLGDTIPVPLPVRPEVVSPGDVLVAAGLGQLVATAMLAAPTSRRGTRSTPRPRSR